MTAHTHDRVVGLNDKKIVVGWLTDHVEGKSFIEHFMQV